MKESVSLRCRAKGKCTVECCVASLYFEREIKLNGAL